MSTTSNPKQQNNRSSSSLRGQNDDENKNIIDKWKEICSNELAAVQNLTEIRKKKIQLQIKSGQIRDQRLNQLKVTLDNETEIRKRLETQ